MTAATGSTAPLGNTNPSRSPPLSQVERVTDTFLAPSRTFQDLLRDRSWWLPFLLLALFSIAAAFVIGHQVGFAQLGQTMVHANPKLEEQYSALPPDQQSVMLAHLAATQRGTAYGVSVLLLVVTALYALLLWGSFNFGLGASTRYSEVFAVTMYASLPYLVTDVLMIVMLLASPGSRSFDLQNPAGTNLAYYLTGLSPGMRVLLARFDVIQLWSVGLTVLGMAVVSRKTLAQSAAVVLTFWVIGTALSAGVAAAFS